MPAGYSGTPLVKKLGLKPGMRVRFIEPPDEYEDLLGRLPGNVTIANSTRGEFDFIHFFSKSERDLRQRLPRLKDALKNDGSLWISWPKKAANVETDLTGDVVRSFGLKSGLVDIKVCAVDETWSGLKFVYRKNDR